MDRLVAAYPVGYTLDGEGSIDVVVDLVAGPQWPSLLDVLRRGGRYATAGAIEQPLGAIGDRADTGSFVEDAVTAKRTFLFIVAEPPDITEEQGIESADNPLVGTRRD